MTQNSAPHPATAPSTSTVPASLSHHEPTELDLSPSKARAHTSTTYAWAQVTDWLQDVLNPSSSTATTKIPLPPFERNSATLASLQSLMHANIAANSTRKYVHDAQVRQLSHYDSYLDSVTQDPGRILVDEIAASLTPDSHVAFTSTATATVQLGYVPSTQQSDQTEDVELRFRKRLLKLSGEVFELERVVASVMQQSATLERQTKAVRNELLDRKTEPRKDYDLHDEGEGEAVITTSWRQQTAQYAAQTKHLSLKLAEYEQRISALSGQSRGAVTVREMRQRQKEVEALEEIVRTMEGQLREYYGLPPDIEASRAEVRRAQSELEALKMQREELFAEAAGNS